MRPIKLQQISHETMVDTRLIASLLGIQHKNVIALIDKYQNAFKRFGALRFNLKKSKGRPTRYFLLNGSQAELLLSLSRNTPESVELTVQFITAFDKARSSLEASNSYTPFYHQVLNSSIHHMNFEKLINRHFGLSAGTRNEQPPEIKLMISAAMALSDRIYKQALSNGQNHKQGYQSVKEALEHHLYLAPAQLKGAA